MIHDPTSSIAVRLRALLEQAERKAPDDERLLRERAERVESLERECQEWLAPRSSDTDLGPRLVKD